MLELMLANPIALLLSLAILASAQTTATVAPTLSSPNISIISVSAGLPFACPTCKSIIRVIEFWASTGLGGNITELIANGCNFAPPSKYQECLDSFGRNAKKITQAIEKKEDPAQVCQEIHACDAPVTSTVTETFVTETFVETVTAPRRPQKMLIKH
ncbi:hypothetical protein PROFUN_09487 [Planoprotostelium fungivorum]|uniref:Saposin B-type domain-containing protein n=1 Tax=Planoprotostelium fungivorum TaxID=1890364 RepID=A0A2P6MPJ5_9EUKA|nr:hypothetical protein PROFUN_16780 [Planoprotostelium fungivorum]PRP83275.1 hypothetical protein PROFUN_09487 [Planoprotostelium fungivorum]